MDFVNKELKISRLYSRDDFTTGKEIVRLLRGFCKELLKVCLS
jgi:hypothetical protein